MRKAYLQNRDAAVRRPLSKRHTVLVIDDDERILKAYARMLASSCDVIMASDGQEAIDLLSSGSSPDAVVTEIALPEVDGRALFEWLRRERPALAARTVFVTSDATRERYRTFLADTMNGILTKPVSANDLWTVLANLVSQRSTSSRPPPRE
jgi:CheY-like chemotaxis protein